MKAVDSSSMDESLDGAGDREAEDPNDEQVQFARWNDLFNYTSKTHSVILVLALISSVASGMIVPALALFFGKIFDYFTRFGAGQINGHDLKQDVSSYACYLVGLGCASGLLNACFYLLWMIFGELQAKGAREKLFSGMIEKEMEWYDRLAAGISTHSSRLQSLVRELQTGTSQPLGCVIQYAVTTVAALGLALYYSWSLTLITLATMPAAAVILARISAQIILSVESQRQELTNSSKVASTAISAIETVKSFNGQDFELWQYAMAIRKVASHYLGQALVQALQNGFLRFFILSIFVQGFWYGSHLVDTGQRSPGDILTCFWACLMAVQTAEAISTEYPYLMKGKVAGATIKASIIHMDRGRRIIPMVGKKSPRRCDGEVEVRNLSFSYPMRLDELALNKVSFHFPAGETTFIVGESGSGKSTLGDLLLGFYSPVSGSILIDGYPIQTLDVNWIRNNVTLVQQRAVLFNETVSKNIAFGCKDHGKVRKEEMKEAIKTALLQYVINDLPQGLDTIVGDSGNAISSGQQQRIVIARARLRNTPILILDEATSALDQTSKTMVVDAIRRWRQGKTTIIITHDMSQVQADDFTYVLEKGEIIQADFRRKLQETEQGPFSKNRISVVTLPHNMKQRPPPLPHVRPSIAHTRTVPRRNSGWYDSGAVRPQQRRTSVQSVFVDGTRRPDLVRVPTSATPAHSFSPQRPSRLSFSTFNQVVRDGRSANPTGTPRIEDAENIEMDTMHGDVMTAVLRQEISAQFKGRRNFLPAIAAALLPKRKRKRNTSRTEDIIPLKSILMTIWPILTWKDRLILILGFACAAIHAAATPTFAYFFAKLLGTFSLPSHSQRQQQARSWSLSILGVAVVDALATYFMHYLLEYCGQAWVNAIRKEAFKRILDQPRSWFDAKENSSTRLTECLDRNAEEMRNLLGRFAAYVFVALIMTLMAILWSMILSWRLTLVGLTCGPFMYLIIHFFESISSRWEARTNTAGSVVNAVFAETFTNIRTVRAFSLQSYFHKKYFRSTHHALRIGLRRSIYAGFFFGLRSSAIVFIGALIYYYGAVLASSHTDSIQTVFTVMTMLLFSLESAASIIGLIPQISSSRATATSLLRLYQLPFRSSHEHTGTLRLSHPGPITFQNLTFTYPTHPTHPILKSLTLTIPEGGHSIALIGASGSGKSTLLSLLLGLHPPTSGTITFTTNNHPISTLHIPTLRSLIAYVPHSPPLFPTTIANNITYALPPNLTSTTIESIHTAARAASIHDFITSLPHGYSTLLGPGGTGLSGGQATRLAIARAIIRRPKFLIMDEPTRGLDYENVRGIREMVRGLVREGVGVVVVTHDVGMMRGCEEVVVMRGGRVWERGGFEEVVGRGGEGARLIGVEGGGGDHGVEGRDRGRRGGRVWDEGDGRGAWG